MSLFLQQDLELCVPQLCDFLSESDTTAITMQILLKIAEPRPECMVEHFDKIKKATKISNNTITLGPQLLATAGRTNKVSSFKKF